MLKQVTDTEGDFWEEYYIRHLHTHYTEGGYNMTYGGKHNPMEYKEVREKHLLVCQGESFREKQRVANKELLAKNSEKQSIKIKATSLDGAVLNFASIRAASKFLGVSNRKAILKCCKENLDINNHFYNNYKWEFA